MKIMQPTKFFLQEFVKYAEDLIAEHWNGEEKPNFKIYFATQFLIMP